MKNIAHRQEKNEARNLSKALSKPKHWEMKDNDGN